MRLFILKPDNIGDFVLSTGAIRALADAVGEENITLCVKPPLVELARGEFPTATILPLPVAAKRKVVNLFLRNLVACLPLLWRLKWSRFDHAICLRSMRNYLETLLFLSTGARRFTAPENLLLRSGRVVRLRTEQTVHALRRTTLVAYPGKATDVPLEIESHRRVVESVLCCPVSAVEILPRLKPIDAAPSETWVLAPLSSDTAKNYPTSKWMKALRIATADCAPQSIQLIGGEEQREKLEEIRATLADALGTIPVVVDLPPDLPTLNRVIATAALVLTVDTAAAHFAAAHDRPAVIAFSGLHTGMFAPWQRTEKQIWLLPDGDSEKPKPKWHDRIAPDRVAEAMRSLVRSEK